MFIDKEYINMPLKNYKTNDKMARKLLRFVYILLAYVLLFTLPIDDLRADPLPEITAKAWLIADEDGKIIEGVHTSEVRSIASITKLMTAIVILDSNASLTEILSKPLYNKKVTRLDLLNLSIVKSDNTAARLLCETYPLGYAQCISDMNYKATLLGMHNTIFVDPTGLFNNNVSTAEDLIKLVNAARHYDVIVNASNTDKLFWTKTKKQKIEFNNTNNSVGKGIDYIVSKTGWIRASGGCIVMMIKTLNGIRTVILLGSKTTKTRIPEAILLSKIH